MIRLEFKALSECPRTKIDFFNSINRIPVSTTLGDYVSLPETIYSRNIFEENFVEFRFDKDTKDLYEITLVAIDKDYVNISENSLNHYCNGYHLCKIIEEESVLEDLLPMAIEKFQNSVKFQFDFVDVKTETLFCIGSNVYVGVNSKSFLTCVILSGLSEDEIFSIFG